MVAMEVTGIIPLALTVLAIKYMYQPVQEFLSLASSNRQWTYLTFKNSPSQTATLPIAISSLFAVIGGDSGNGCLSTGAWVSGSTLAAYSTWQSGSVGIWYVVIGS